ncbi:MAG: 50S ribosomal protein L22 [Hyphomonadaceae bacterium]
MAAKKKAAASQAEAPAKKKAGKPKAPPKQAANEARAVLRSLRISPQKLNLVAQSIRGLSAENAVNELRFSRKRIAKDVLKCLRSAIDNAENNHSLDVDSLVVTQAHVGKNIVMKRMHARARGRGVRIEKHFSQLTIVLRDTTQQAEAA